jgi:hypothetical protein
MGAMLSAVTSLLGFESASELENQRAPLHERERVNFEELQILKKELANYDTDGYRAFRNSVLASEEVRIARVAVQQLAKGAKESELQKIVGQYAEVERLMTRPDDIAAEIEAVERQRLEILTALSEVDEKIKLAKSREGK